MHQKEAAPGDQPRASQDRENSNDSVTRTPGEGNGGSYSRNANSSHSEGDRLPHWAEQRDAIERNFPRRLRELPQWVCWQSRQRPDKPKPDKVPVQASGAPASTTDVSTWTGVDDALAAVPRLSAAGVGFVFNAGDGVTGIDLDHCRDVETGKIDPWARSILDRTNSYTEISPSGTGLHIYIRATKPPSARCKKPVKGPDAAQGAQVEVYNQGRYFTVTGNRLTDYPATVEPRQTELEELCLELWPPGKGPSRSPFSGPSGGSGGGGFPSDEDVLRVMFSGPRGAHHEALYNGDTSLYDGDPSRADIALAGALAFFSGDRFQVERLWMGSRLGQREKTQIREDYRRLTLDAVFDGLRDRFDWTTRRVHGGRESHRRASSSPPGSDDDGVDANDGRLLVSDNYISPVTTIRFPHLSAIR